MKVVDVENDEGSSVSVAPHLDHMSGQDCRLEAASAKQARQRVVPLIHRELRPLGGAPVLLHGAPRNECTSLKAV
jgi:hypothetical protein